MIERRNILPLAILALLVLLAGLFSTHTLTSVYQDIGRHITLGRIIWQTKHIPTTNLFSYTNTDFPFIDHHWLAEVLMHWGDQLFGLQRLILIKALMIAAAFGLALAAAWKHRLAVPAMVVGLVGAAILSERTDLRPEVLSFLFLGWFLFVLYRKADTRLLWTLPLVQILWVNSHIYFFMGPFLWLAFLAGEIISASDKRLAIRKVFTSHFALVTLAIALGTLLNPHGLSGALYPLKIWGNYGYSIVENQSPAFLRAFGYPQFTTYAAYAGIALVIISFILNRRNIRYNIFGLVIASATAVLALTMIRNFPLFGLCMMPAVISNLHTFRLSHLTTRSSMIWGLIFATLLSVSIITGQLYRQLYGGGRSFGLHVPTGPQEPVNFFRRNGLNGPIFNNFDIGSFLIWKLPEEPVFIDGRPEAYPADFIQQVYIPMQEDQSVWQRYSAYYGIKTIFWNEQDITPWSRIFVACILKDPSWKLVYRGQGVIILTRK
jgi:hypothetical protein